MDVPLDMSVVVNWRREYKFLAVTRVRRRVRVTETVDNALNQITLANSYSPPSQYKISITTAFKIVVIMVQAWR